ncbi:Growth arrest and DNA damage-inducible protein GADD45 beta [Fukomys damarensis]|uniref:Growth arrest and DNA damage-inducible protein GADD45 beta n=1 Tax=Fukomys damarensis TaxID=885580 RepID=A0A091DEZ6_FUKDA|nr:Growth arrest and DNA damage-inducible protein GADD45 beta [Fukomys damarensis]
MTLEELVTCDNAAQKDPDSVVLCLLAIDEEEEDDIALQIHFTLIQSFCCDNDIDIVRVHITNGTHSGAYTELGPQAGSELQPRETATCWGHLGPVPRPPRPPSSQEARHHPDPVTHTPGAQGGLPGPWSRDQGEGQRPREAR